MVKRPKQSGFTLIEMLYVVVITAVLTVVLVPVFNWVATATKRARAVNAELINREIADGILDYVSSDAAAAELPLPATVDGRPGNVVDPSDTSDAVVALKQRLVAQGVSASQINSDGTAAANARIYQTVDGLTKTVSLSGKSGPSVVLTYQVGALYQTDCPASSACATNGLGYSEKLSDTNYLEWSTMPPDGNAVMFSSYPVQEQLLKETDRRVQYLKNRIATVYRSAELVAAADSKQNFYPAGSPSASGASPAANMGCHDGWYSLTATSVLAQVGLSPDEYGTTAWGGGVEFCRDYDPGAVKSEGTPPFYAAIRFNKSVSLGLTPDPTNVANDVILSF